MTTRSAPGGRAKQPQNLGELARRFAGAGVARAQLEDAGGVRSGGEGERLVEAAKEAEAL